MSRPPLILRILYRTDVWVLGPRWKEWVEQDVASPSFSWKEAAALTGITLAAVALYTALSFGGSVLYVLAGLLAALELASLFFPRLREARRNSHLRRHRRRWARADARARKRSGQ